MSVNLKKFLSFYVRFTPSYTGIGYIARGLPLQPLKLDLKGQNWLVVGGSEGIGHSVSMRAADAGATVFANARGKDRLDRMAGEVTGSGAIKPLPADMSTQRGVWSVVDTLKESGRKIDVLVNNVGIMTHHVTTTEDGFETSFAVSIQNHYLLVKALIEEGLLAENAVVIEVSSGGMYNHPLVIDEMNNQNPETFEAKRNYGLNKRAQVELTAYWRKKYAATGMSFYVMHPGWCDTAPVRRDMPTFHRNLKLVLRNSDMGGDTILWLAARRPAQKQEVAIWFDRKERPPHIYARTRQSKYTREDLVEFLDGNIVPVPAKQKIA